MDQGSLQGAALRLLGDAVDQVVIETSDEVNETATEETTEAPEETTEAPEETTEAPKGDDEADSVVVGGSLELAVEEPQAFCADSSVQTGLKAAIATAAQADVADVMMRCRVAARRLSEEAPPARRLAGTVIIEYTVVTTSALVDYLQYLDEDAWTRAINEALADAGSDLAITVVNIALPTVQDSPELPEVPEPEPELEDDGAVGVAFPAMSLLSTAIAVCMSLGKQ